MINIQLTKEEYEILLNELRSLHGYHWNDDNIHANDCGSKVIDIIESKAIESIESKPEILSPDEEFEKFHSDLGPPPKFIK